MPGHDDDTYLELAHAVMTGVSYELEYGSKDDEPKQLVTGNNLRAVDHAALVTLLIKHGVFTDAEYRQAVRDQAQLEVERLEKKLSKTLGTTVTLG